MWRDVILIRTCDFTSSLSGDSCEVRRGPRPKLKPTHVVDTSILARRTPPAHGLSALFLVLVCLRDWGACASNRLRPMVSCRIWSFYYNTCSSNTVSTSKSRRVERGRPLYKFLSIEIFDASRPKLQPTHVLETSILARRTPRRVTSARSFSSWCVFGKLPFLGRVDRLRNTWSGTDRM